MPRTFLLLFVFFAGCQTTSPSNAGFLADYAQLQPHPDDPDILRWLSPAAGYYGEILVVPQVAYFHANVHGYPVDADALDTFLTRLRGAIIDALDDDYLLATQPGPGVLRLAVAVTDLFKEPGSKGGLGLRDANVEMRGVDSVTGTVVFAAVYSKRLANVTASDSGDALDELARRWAERVRTELGAAEAE